MLHRSMDIRVQIHVAGIGSLAAIAPAPTQEGLLQQVPDLVARDQEQRLADRSDCQFDVKGNLLFGTRLLDQFVPKRTELN